MACRRSVNKNNLLRWERVYGGLTIAELQAQGISALCNPADVAPPFDLVATSGIDEIVLDWQYEGQNDGFIIYRSTDNVTFSILDAVTEAIRDYTDSTATIGIIYYYYIVATNGTFVSAPSNTASAESLTAFVFDYNTSTAGSSGVGNALLPLALNATNFNLDIYQVIAGNYVFIRKVTDSAGRTITAAELGSAGTKTIALIGTMLGWAFNNGGDRLKITNISRWGSFNPDILTGAFYGCSNLEVTATDTPNLIDNSITSLSLFFGLAQNMLMTTNVNNWDVSQITDFNNCFAGCNKFNRALNNWNVSNGANMQNMLGMFSSPASLFNQDITGWNVANVTNMQSMFGNSKAFNQNISVWNVANVTNFGAMFDSASLFNQNLGAWVLNSGITIMASMFRNSGMSTANYTDTIVGWANNIFDRGGVVTSKALTTQTGRTFQNSRSGGANFATAGDARTYLVSTLGWTISGDTVIA
jgi:surface protein